MTNVNSKAAMCSTGWSQRVIKGEFAPAWPSILGYAGGGVDALLSSTRTFPVGVTCRNDFPLGQTRSFARGGDRQLP